MKALFLNNVNRVINLGFDFNQSLNIIKRVNEHISFCVENQQNYDETLFFIEQDFSFEKLKLEAIVIDCILSEPTFEKYYN
jgi:hypothetical protein